VAYQVLTENKESEEIDDDDDYNEIDDK